MSTPTADAQRLKEEGNALFGKKLFRAAMAKYTAAIDLDGTNAVLFANRAACSFGLRRFVEAEADARKATELDPAYPKAWARHATAKQELGLWEQAIESWNHAIDAIPRDTELSAADKKQRDLYTANLKRAQAALDGMEAQFKPFTIGVRVDQGKLPWQRANALYPPGSSGSTNSSAWVIIFAYEEWRRGIEGLNKLVKEGDGMQGEIFVIESLSNGILRDNRVFGLNQPDFPTRYNDQLVYETWIHYAKWTEMDSKTILKEATERLRSETWEAVRPALEFTVRTIFMRAFLVYIGNQDCGAAVTCATQCIEILEGGMKLWPDVAHELVFCRSFLRGVKTLRLQAYVGACKTAPEKFPLEELELYADEFFADALTDPLPPSDFDPGFVLSFWTYPKAEALATSGLCATDRGQLCKTEEEARPFWMIAGKFYEDAAKLLPEDEENRCCYLNAAIDKYQEAKAPLMTIMPLLVLMKESVPKMKKIWEHSAATLSGRDALFENLLLLEKKLQRKINEGSISLSSPWEG